MTDRPDPDTTDDTDDDDLDAHALASLRRSLVVPEIDTTVRDRQLRAALDAYEAAATAASGEPASGAPVVDLGARRSRRARITTALAVAAAIAVAIGVVVRTTAVDDAESVATAERAVTSSSPPAAPKSESEDSSGFAESGDSADSADSAGATRAAEPSAGGAADGSGDDAVSKPVPEPPTSIAASVAAPIDLGSVPDDAALRRAITAIMAGDLSVPDLTAVPPPSTPLPATPTVACDDAEAPLSFPRFTARVAGSPVVAALDAAGNLVVVDRTACTTRSTPP